MQRSTRPNLTSRWLALPVVARRLDVSFWRALALVRGNRLRARLVSGHYWVAELELRRFAREWARQNAPGATIATRPMAPDGGRAA